MFADGGDGAEQNPARSVPGLCIFPRSETISMTRLDIARRVVPRP